MENNLQMIKEEIIQLCKNPDFIHHKWFVTWHLNIVEKISLELCEVYTDADREVVRGLVWMHDYAKIIDYEHEHSPEVIQKGRDFLLSFGCSEAYVDTVMSYLDIFESKMNFDLNEAPLEVKIVSSADGASHMVGPFLSIYWYEHPEKSVEELVESNRKKLLKDWERKIVIPEVKEMFQDRYNILMSLCEDMPGKFLRNPGKTDAYFNMC